MATIKEDKTIKGKKSNEPPAAVSKFNPGQIKIFAGEVKTEFNKIAWPDKKHTMATTGVVIVLVVMISFYLGAVDLLLGKMIGFVLK